MVGCPTDAIHRSPITREMRIESWCIGCGLCARNCPYGNINMHGIETGEIIEDPSAPGVKKAVMREKATMCDLCVGLYEEPSCVYACPHDAAHRYDADQFKEILSKQAARKK
jgi:Fe-S-cluster-containing hydrogenase component 2